MLRRDTLVGHERHEMVQKLELSLQPGVELSKTSCVGSTTRRMIDRA